MSQQDSSEAREPNGQDGVGALMWVFVVIWLVGGFILLIWAVSPSLAFFGETATERARAEASSRWNVTTWLLLGYGAAVSILAAILRRWIWAGLFMSVSAGVLLLR